MPTPFKPREFEALIIQEDDTLCTALKNLTQLSTMWWAMMAFKYKPTADGFTTEYAALVTAALAACPDPAVEFDGIVPNPQDFKNFLLSPTSIFCEKFVKFATGVSEKLHAWIAFEWNPEGTDFTDEFKALLCGIDCAEPEAIDIQSLLNYRDFEKWDVVDGEVDLIGISPWLTAIANPAGLYVDLHGTYQLAGARSGVGVIRTKSAFAVMLETGKEYTITFRQSGHGIGNANLTRPGTVIYTLRKLSDLSTYDAVTGTFTAAAWNSSFVTRTITFTATSSEYVIFELAGDPNVATWGGQNVGPKIDTVKIRNTTDGVTLFYDDFEIEETRSGAVPCGTPDPDDAMNAIPQVSMEVCERLQKIVQAFPANLYDVASFEFNPAGSGFSKCLKAWLCTPDGTVENGLLLGLVAYWKHDESSGDVLDSHTGGYDLTEVGGTLASQPGKIVGSRLYGSGEAAFYADAAWNDLSATSWTITGWIKLSTFGGGVFTNFILASKGPSVGPAYFVHLSSLAGDGSDIVIEARNSSVSADTLACGAMVLGDWYFMAARYDLSTQIMKVSFGSGTTLSHGLGTSVGPSTDTTDDFLLGKRINGASYVGAEVELDEVSLWSRALSDEELSTLFNGGAGKPYSEFTE